MRVIVILSYTHKRKSLHYLFLILVSIYSPIKSRDEDEEEEERDDLFFLAKILLIYT